MRKHSSSLVQLISHANFSSTHYIYWLPPSLWRPARAIPTLNRHAVLGFSSMCPRRLERGAYGDFTKNYSWIFPVGLVVSRQKKQLSTDKKPET